MERNHGTHLNIKDNCGNIHIHEQHMKSLHESSRKHMITHYFSNNWARGCDAGFPRARARMDCQWLFPMDL